MAVGTQFALWLDRDEALEQVRAGATLVTANDRLARTLRQAYNEMRLRNREAAWQSPRIHSWGVWLDRLWRDLEQRLPDPPPVRLSPLQERALWERVIAGDAERQRLLAIEPTAEAARRAAQLVVEWRIDSSAIEESESEEVRSFVRWRRHAEKWIEQGGWISAARTADFLIRHSREIDPGVVLLAGFDTLTPQQSELLDALRAAGWSVRDVSEPQCEKPTIRRVQLDGRRDEIRAAARWAKNLVDSGDTGKIGVVVPGLAARRQEVERAFTEAFDVPALLLQGSGAPRFALSAGLPLDRLPLVRTALLSLEMNPDATDLATFGAWLCSDAIAGGVAERIGRGMLDRALRDKGAPTLAPARLGGQLTGTTALRKALRRWSRRYAKLPPRQKPALWAASFSSLLEAMGWPGEAAETREGQAMLLAWNELLSAFAALSAVVDDWDFATARRALARMARETTYRPEATDVQVEVIDLLDSAGAQVDHLWLTGLDDETWPDEARPNPFLPIALQREKGLPHASAARELEFARIETKRLLSAAPDIVVSHAQSADDRKLGPSPLIAALPLVELDALVDASRASLIASMHNSARLERAPDVGTPCPPESTSLGGAKIFELQAHCPFRAFATLRLGAKSLGSAVVGMSPGERGNLAHHALERIWSELKGSEDLHGRSAAELRQILADASAFALERIEERRRTPLPPRFRAAERARLKQLLSDWLEIERTHRTAPFQVEAVEQKHSVHVLGLTAEVRVDRIDRLADGRLVILDYKTGVVKEKEWDEERSMQPQLPLYAVHHAESLAAVLFARLKRLETGFKGAVAPGVVIEGAQMDRADEFEDRVRQWRTNLEALAADYLAGRAEIDPRDGKCQYCDLASLCRKDDV